MKPAMGEDQLLALALEGKVHAVQGSTAQLLELAGNLALLPDPEIDETFAAALEAQLLTDGLATPAVPQTPRLTVVKPVQAPAPAPVRPDTVVQLPRRRLVVRRSLVGIAVAAALGAFPVAMAANALPGSPFYGLKHFAEQMWDARPGSALDHAMRHVSRANEHLDEAQKLIALGNKDGASDALKMAQDELSDAVKLGWLQKGNPVDMSKFNDFLQSTTKRMAAIQDEISGPPTVFGTPAASHTQPQAPQRSSSSGDTATYVKAQAGDTKTSAKHSADDTIDKTGHGDGVHQVEGCTPPLQATLQPAQAGDTFAFMCRWGQAMATLKQ